MNHLDIRTTEGVLITGLIGLGLLIIIFGILIIIEHNLDQNRAVVLSFCAIGILITYIFKIGGHKMIISLFKNDEQECKND